MPFHTLWTTVDHPQAIVDFTKGLDRIFDFFITGDGDGKFLDFTRLQAKAQPGYTLGNLAATDYVCASIGVPIFSTRFVERLGERLQGDMEFFDCAVFCQGQETLFHAAKLKHSIPNLVDKTRSTFSSHTSARLLIQAVYDERIGVPFQLARDPEFPERFVASEPFKDLVEEAGLAIRFLIVDGLRSGA